MQRKRNRGKLGFNVRRYRRLLDLTQTDLAKMASLSQAQVAAIETGRQKNITVKTLGSLASALSVSLESLLME